MNRPLNVGSVRYINACPLNWGLACDPTVRLSLDVPSNLLGGLSAGRFDVALLPVIDYQRLGGLRLLRSGGIGCDGPTLTVRLFSRVPPERIRTLACDPDSHTSVALTRIILAERFENRPKMVTVGATDASEADAVLLIGDKVVCGTAPRTAFELDLGGEWKAMTSLPFVFAAWCARAGIDLRDLPARLERALREGLENVARIVTEQAVPRGWPADLAFEYLTQRLKFDIGARQIEAISLFHRLAHRHGAFEHEPWPLVEVPTVVG